MLLPTTQLYTHCVFKNMETSWEVFERCIQDIGHWMLANHLKLNSDKTELLWTGTRHNLSRLTGSEPRLVLGTKVIDASGSACNLAVTFTSDLCLEKHASIISGRCFSTYISCHVYDTHTTRKRHRHSYIGSSPATSTITTV